MGGLRRKPIPPPTDDEIIRVLARVSSRSSVRAQRFSHSGKSYIAYEGGVPGFESGKALMAAVEEHDLEGIVAKRKSDPYRRGVSWWKVRNPAYSQADDGRGDLLNGDRRGCG